MQGGTEGGMVRLRDLADQPWIDHDIYDSLIDGSSWRATAAGFTPRYAARA